MRYWMFWILLLGASQPRAVSAQVVGNQVRTDGFYYCVEEDRIQDTTWHNNKPLIFSGAGHFLLSIVAFYPDGGTLFDFWELPQGTVVDPASLGVLQKENRDRFVPRSWGVYAAHQDSIACVRTVHAEAFQQYVIADLFKTVDGNTLWGLKKVSRPSKGPGKEVDYTPPMVFRFVPFSALPQERKPRHPLLSAEACLFN